MGVYEMVDEKNQSHEEFAEEFARRFGNTVNRMGYPQEEIVAQMLREHRTIQQEFMKFFMHFVEEMSKNTSDLRNEASVALAKEIMAIDEMKRFLPHI